MFIRFLGWLRNFLSFILFLIIMLLRLIIARDGWRRTEIERRTLSLFPEFLYSRTYVENTPQTLLVGLPVLQRPKWVLQGDLLNRCTMIDYSYDLFNVFLFLQGEFTRKQPSQVVYAEVSVVASFLLNSFICPSLQLFIGHLSSRFSTLAIKKLYEKSFVYISQQFLNFAYFYNCSPSLLIFIYRV